MAARQRRRSRDGTTQPARERVGHEAPGVIRHGPPLSITCTCGSKASVRFGTSWTCEDCGRTWDTSRIPRREYNQIRWVQLRFRAVPVLLGLLVVAIAAFFTVTGNAGGVVPLLPIALLAWYMLRGPHRRRYARAIAKRHSWTLRGEP